jgi:hypothetical protein
MLTISDYIPFFQWEIFRIRKKNPQFIWPKKWYVYVPPFEDPESPIETMVDR